MSDTFGASAYLVLPPDAERMVESLKEQPLDTIGVAQDWIAHHHTMEKLNLQAHQSAQKKQDNFVIEALLTHQKLPAVIVNLLALELWKANVLPLLQCQDSEAASLRLYFIVYHEATLTNLLEVAFYHEHVVESLDDDLTIELVDYCVRKLSWLLGLPRGAIAANTTFHKSGHEIVQLLSAEHGARRELARQQLEIEFRLAVQCVTLLRYVAERLHLLPLSIVSRLLDTHDVLLSLAALIENPPWTHKALVATGGGEAEVQWKKFVNQKWVFVAPGDLLILTPTEAQVWLAVYYLLCTKSAREHYEVTAFRKDQLLRVRKYLNDLLLDQLPLLADVQRYLDELSIMQVGSSAGSRGGGLVMEAVPYLRVGVARKFATKYAGVAARFDALSASMRRADDLRELAEVYQMEGIDELLDGDSGASFAEPPGAPRPPSSEPATATRTPRRVTLVFHDRPSEPEPAMKTKTPLIVEIGTSDAGLTNDADRAATRATTTVVVVECAVDAESRKEMETKTHRYARYALRVVTADDSSDKRDATVACRAAAEAQIWFGDSESDSVDDADDDNDSATPVVTLTCPDLQLPTPSGRREKLWTQLGSLQEASLVVVQCQFVSDDPSNQDDDSSAALQYRLGALFLSVPC
ncbi:hypothetical protein PybrP1_001604 [[Pythium] brassicae (nom. inval.)]|nr:hypothetical protein PybrP1_001604 [[Pythium] brassicae (nom. inval.)]